MWNSTPDRIQRQLRRRDTANAVLAKIRTTGKVCIYASVTTDIVIDANGYTPTTN